MPYRHTEVIEEPITYRDIISYFRSLHFPEVQEETWEIVREEYDDIPMTIKYQIWVDSEEGKIYDIENVYNFRTKERKSEVREVDINDIWLIQKEDRCDMKIGNIYYIEGRDRKV